MQANHFQKQQELEMIGLKTNMEIWEQTLGNKDFDAAVDHKSIPQIMTAKDLPPSDRIIRLLEALGRISASESFTRWLVQGHEGARHLVLAENDLRTLLICLRSFSEYFCYAQE